MSYRIEIRPRAAREYRKLQIEIRESIAERNDTLAGEPRPPGAMKLSGTQNGYRIRVGTYRILYEIRDDLLVVVVARVGHRRGIYR